MTRDEALAFDLALEALSSIDIYLSDTLSGRVNPEPATYTQWLIDGIIEARNRSRAPITAIKQVRSAPAHDPVAWGVFEGGNLHDMFFTQKDAEDMAHLKGSHAEVRPLCASPAAQRQWVGLTPHERMMCRSYDVDTAIDKTEAKLKELNT